MVDGPGEIFPGIFSQQEDEYREIRSYFPREPFNTGLSTTRPNFYVHNQILHQLILTNSHCGYRSQDIDFHGLGFSRARMFDLKRNGHLLDVEWKLSALQYSSHLIILFANYHRYYSHLIKLSLILSFGR